MIGFGVALGLTAKAVLALKTAGVVASGAVGGAVIDRFGGRVVKGIGKGISYVGEKMTGDGSPAPRKRASG